MARDLSKTIVVWLFSQDSMGEIPNRWLEAQGLGAPLLCMEATFACAVRTRWDSSRARTNAIRLHWWRGLRSNEREARVYPGCGAAGGARAPPRQPLPTTGVLVTTGPAAIRAGHAPNGQARLCQGSPGPARPLARAAAAGTRPKILTLCFRSISTRATQPGTCHRGALHCRGGPADQRQSAALVARTAQLRARSASLPRGAQGAGQPEVRARPPGSFCRPAARTRHRRRH